jgi:hypothetical protein
MYPYTVCPRSRPRRLFLELLEERTVLSTLYVVPPGAPLDATHLPSYHDAFQAAAAGDVIQMEPGTAVSSVGAGVVGSREFSGGDAGSISITIDEPSIRAGEMVVLDQGTAAEETRLVEKSLGGGAGGNTLILNQRLTFNHNGSPASQVKTLGVLGIDKGITIQGDIGVPAQIPSQVEVLAGTTGAGFVNVNYSHPFSLEIDNGCKQTRILNSFLTGFSEVIGHGNQGNVFSGNVMSGGCIVNGDVTGTTADVVTNNVFTASLGQGNAGIFMINNNGARVQGNVFNLSGASINAIHVINSTNVTVSNNIIHITNADAFSTGIRLFNSAAFPGTVSVKVANNTVNTGGIGRGVLTVKSATGATLSANLLGNDLHGNAIGVDIQGDGTSPGDVNLGDLTPGSPGGNNFRDFTAAGVAGGRFALRMSSTAANTTTPVPAAFNLWSVPDPTTVIKDGTHNTTTAATPNGTGTFDVGQGQLPADEAYIQTLYHDFLGRTGGIEELSAWDSYLPQLGRMGVANNIARSDEALKRVVDRYYLRFLQRPAEPAGEAGWIHFLQNGGTEEQLVTSLLTSPEYADHVKDVFGGIDQGFVMSLYTKLLGRNTSVTEINAWVAALPGVGRAAVVTAFVSSSEYRANAVRGFYTDLLHRTAATMPPDSEVLAWVNSPFDLLTIEIAITTSDDFYRNG